MLIKSLSEHRSFGGLPLYCNVAPYWILMLVILCYQLWVCASRVRQWWCNTMLFRNDLPSAPLLSTHFLWIDNSECVFCTLWRQEYIMCVLHWLQTWIVCWICLSEIKTLSGLWQDVECGAHLNSIVSHSSPRKASLDMHWCVLDLVISSANCHEGKFRCRCAVVLFKRDTHAQTNSDSYNRKHSNTHARSLIILGPSCEERRLIWSNVTWKITHSQDTVLKRQSPYSSFILKRTCV